MIVSAANLVDAELVVVVHHADVVRLAVVVLDPAMAQVQGVAELVHDRAAVVVVLDEVVAADLAPAAAPRPAVGVVAVDLHRSVGVFVASAVVDTIVAGVAGG